MCSCSLYSVLCLFVLIFFTAFMSNFGLALVLVTDECKNLAC